jgi:hypothetical protein
MLENIINEKPKIYKECLIDFKNSQPEIYKILAFNINNYVLYPGIWIYKQNIKDALYENALYIPNHINECYLHIIDGIEKTYKEKIKN